MAKKHGKGGKVSVGCTCNATKISECTCGALKLNVGSWEASTDNWIQIDPAVWEDFQEKGEFDCEGSFSGVWAESMSVVDQLHLFLPPIDDNGNRVVRLINGPADGIPVTLPKEQWDAGIVKVERAIRNGKKMKTVRAIYRKVGRDNAAFEYAGDE